MVSPLVFLKTKKKKIKDCVIDKDFVANYKYSLDYIKQNSTDYSLFLNFKYLFEYVDIQNRIELVSKKSQIQLFDKFAGLCPQNGYRVGTVFIQNEIKSYIQISAYDKVVNKLNTSLENILHYVFNVVFKEKYKFAENACFIIPSNSNSSFEKVHLLAREFESVLKQYKLFVDLGYIDFEILHSSSKPCTIKDILSLNKNKYIYVNEYNKEIIGCSDLMFSNQTHLTYIEPFKEQKYSTLFELFTNEKVLYSNYDISQKSALKYLVINKFINIDENGFIQFTNTERLLILKDLYENEVASFHHYSVTMQRETQKMVNENIAVFESSLFSRPEQEYFCYFLEKVDFSNGLDLRNKCLVDSQAKSDELQKQERSYFTYLKLLFLTMLKIEDDLIISNALKK